MRTFSGFMSRWTTPASWIAASPFATSRPMWRQSSSGTRSKFGEEVAQRLPLDVLHHEEVVVRGRSTMSASASYVRTTFSCTT